MIKLTVSKEKNNNVREDFFFLTQDALEVKAFHEEHRNQNTLGGRIPYGGSRGLLPPQLGLGLYLIMDLEVFYPDSSVGNHTIRYDGFEALYPKS